ncbi:hypothetical protein ACGXPH_004921, partial [Escherichia coli]
MKMKPQYQTRYELLHESYQKWLTGFTRHAVSWGVCHPNIYYFHNLTPGWVSFNGEKPEIANCCDWEAAAMLRAFPLAKKGEGRARLPSLYASFGKLGETPTHEDIINNNRSINWP